MASRRKVLSNGGQILPETAVLSLIGMAIRVQPGQQFANAAAGQRDAGIGGTVIEIDGVTVGCHGVAARKDDVLNISVTFVVRFGREHPGIAAIQAFVRLFKIEERETEAIDGA